MAEYELPENVPTGAPARLTRLFWGSEVAKRSKLALLVLFSIVSVLFWAAVIEYLVRVGPFGHHFPGTM
jgi:hypothetical protein